MEKGLSAETTGFLEPDRIVRSFDLEKGDHAADFGAGHGYFTVPLAREVGGNGKVYAIDIQKPVLDIIRAKAKIEHLLNIEPVWADLDTPRGSKLKDDFLDFVLISNAFFQSEKKEIIIQEAYRVLHKKGRLAIIEWEEFPNFGPPKELLVRKETAKKMAQEAGFELDREFEAGTHHYGLLFIKK